VARTLGKGQAQAEVGPGGGTDDGIAMAEAGQALLDVRTDAADDVVLAPYAPHVDPPHTYGPPWRAPTAGVNAIPLPLRPTRVSRGGLQRGSRSADRGEAQVPPALIRWPADRLR